VFGNLVEHSFWQTKYNRKDLRGTECRFGGTSGLGEQKWIMISHPREIGEHNSNKDEGAQQHRLVRRTIEIDKKNMIKLVRTTTGIGENNNNKNW
jgi:hypothetical protein